MRRIVNTLLLVTLACGVFTGSVMAQAGAEKTPEKKVEYVSVSAREIEQKPEHFKDRHVQLPDRFDRKLDSPPRSLRRFKITRSSHVAFYTHTITGSNMICVVSKKDKAAVGVIGTLIEESPVYLLGKVGPLINTARGEMPIFRVDQMLRGHQPPTAEPENDKPITIIVEYLAPAPDGTVKPRLYKRYTISKFGKRYVIPDPYDGRKKILITLAK